MDTYSIMAATASIPCTEDEYRKLKGILDEHDENPDNLYHWMELSFTKIENEIWGELLVFSDEFGDFENIPSEFLNLVGFLIARQNMEYLECGVAYIGDKDPGDVGGYYFRLLPDGSKQEPELVYRQNQSRPKRITSIIVKEEYDHMFNPEHLLTKIEDGRIVESGRYADSAMDMYGLEKVQAWIVEDQELHDSYRRGERWAVGIWAEATIETGGPNNWARNTIRTSGLWGIEYDATEDHKQSVADEEMTDLSDILRDLGFSDCEIKEATDKAKKVDAP